MAPMVVAVGRIVIALVAVSGLTACAADTTPGAAPEQTAEAAPSPVASVVAVSPSPPTVRVETQASASPAQSGPGAFRYSVQIPQLVGLTLHGQAIDSLIRGAIQRDLDAFLAAAQDAQAPTDLTCISRTIRVTAKLAVLRVDCTSSQAGVARPTTVTHTFNCDLAGARILQLQDLFGAGSAYLDVLSTATRSQFPPQATPVAGRTLLDGTAPIADNFKAFLLDRASMVIVFPGFQRSPSTAAEPEVTISYDDLHRYLAPGIADLLTD